MMGTVTEVPNPKDLEDTRIPDRLEAIPATQGIQANLDIQVKEAEGIQANLDIQVKVAEAFTQMMMMVDIQATLLEDTEHLNRSTPMCPVSWPGWPTNLLTPGPCLLYSP